MQYQPMSVSLGSILTHSNILNTDKSPGDQFKFCFYILQLLDCHYLFLLCYLNGVMEHGWRELK